MSGTCDFRLVALSIVIAAMRMQASMIARRNQTDTSLFDMLCIVYRGDGWLFQTRESGVGKIARMVTGRINRDRLRANTVGFWCQPTLQDWEFDFSVPGTSLAISGPRLWLGRIRTDRRGPSSRGFGESSGRWL